MALSLLVELDNGAGGWTRIDQTNRVLALSSERGQREIFGPVEPGECFLTLDNADGQLDPLNASSPYAAMLTDDRLLRVSWVREDTGALDTMFLGRVETWPIRYGVGVLHHPVVLHVAEELARIGQTMLPHSLVVHELTKGTRYPRPLSMWVMDEDVTAPDALVADRLGGWDATPVNSPQSADVLPYGRGGLQATNNFRKGPHLEVNVLALPAPPWSVMGVVQIDTGGNIDVLGDSGVPSNDLVLKVRGKGGDTRQVEVGQVRSGGTTITVEGTLFADDVGADDGEVCLVAMVDDTVQLALYRVTKAITKLYTGSHGALDSPVGPLRMGRGMDAAYALVCIWGRVVSLTHLEAMRDDVVQPWAGHKTDQRLAALLDLVAPDLPRTLDPSLNVWSFVMLPVRFDVPALDLFRRVVQSADGELWVNRSGVVRFRERQRGFPATASRTYGVGGISVSSIEVASAGLGKVTECVATNEAGSRASFRSEAATDHRLELSDMTLRDPVDLWLLAERTVHHRSNVPAHVSSFTLEPGFTGYDDPLSLDIYDRVNVGYTRTWAPGTITDELEVINVRHEGSASSAGRRWVTTVATRPARRPRIRVRANGTTGEGAYTPGRTSIAPSLADLDIRAHVMGQDPVDTMSGTLISRADGVEQSQFILAMVDFGTGGRAVRFTWWSSSTTTVAITSPAIFPSGSDFRRPVWIRVTLDVSTATVTFWRSDNGDDWQALHSSSQPGHETTVFSVSAVEIGASGSGASPIQGFITEARIYANDVLTSHFDPSSHAPDLIGATFGSDISGETWTVRANSLLSAW